MTADVVRWRRHGKERLYVIAADGTRLGYRDVRTGQDFPVDPHRTAEFEAALRTAPLGVPVPAQRSGKAPAAREEPEETPEAPAAATHLLSATTVNDVAKPRLEDCAWEDLATRRAGFMAREQALALKRAAPIRTFFARLLRVHTEERAWRIGADGEEIVAAQLTKMARRDPRWRQLHAIPVGDNGADIDHLVIGPGGVFSVNTKHHPGSKVWVGGNTLMVNGHRQPYVRNSQHEAQRAARLLTVACGFPVPVTGMVVVVGARKLTVKTAPSDVHVVNCPRLVRWLRDRPTVVPDEQIGVIFEAARRSTTWRPVQ